MKKEVAMAEEKSEVPKNKARNSSKMGRKGDPRMHRAVALRLAEPKMPLLEALRKGGFEFPENGSDDSSMMDSDMVTLGQRKNQLSRRIRLAKTGSDPNASPSKKRRKSSVNGGSSEVATELLQASSTSPESLDVNNNATTGTSTGMDDADMQDEMANATNRMAKFHPNYHPLFVAQARNGSLNMAGTSWNVSQTMAAVAAAQLRQQNSPQGQQNLQQQQQQQQVTPQQQAAMNHLNHVANPYSCFQSLPQSSGVAVASLNATAASAGMTLEQLAVALSATPNLSMVLRNQPTPNKQELALHLYRNESQALYKRCLLLAGYDAREINDSHPSHVEFALRAWEAEGKRLQQLQQLTSASGVNNTNASTNASANSGSNSKAGSISQEAATAKGVQSGGKAKDDDECCLNGRHVHRLEGLCGHKAIVHQPENGPAHVDFIVNNKVECYQGIRPVGNKAAFWPSNFKCEEISCNQDAALPAACGGESCEKDCEKECVVPEIKEPKIFHLNDIDLNGKEWSTDFFNMNSGHMDETLLGMVGLGADTS